MVRLLLSAQGSIAISASPVEVPSAHTVWRFVISQNRVDERNVFFYHKTTRREFYEQELARQKERHGCDEVLFLNTRGELTEAARTNLFLELDGELATPPVECGLLAGTLRAELLENGEKNVVERVLTLDDLARADGIYLGNSVRGLVRAELMAEPQKSPVLSRSG